MASELGLERVPLPTFADWLEEFGVWMPVDRGWVRGFVSDDGRFFADNRSLRAPVEEAPDNAATTIPNVGEDRTAGLYEMVHFSKDGDDLTPGLSVGTWMGNVHTLLVFEGVETISHWALATSSRFGPTRWPRLFFELTDEIEVVTIYRP